MHEHNEDTARHSEAQHLHVTARGWLRCVVPRVRCKKCRRPCGSTGALLLSHALVQHVPWNTRCKCKPTLGECLPGARPACYFSINYPDFSPRFTLSRRSPPSRPRCTAHLPYKARCIIKQYLWIQPLQLSSVLYLTNKIGPTSVGVNTFSAIVLLTLITNCDGGALLATQHTHFCLILCLILCATIEHTAAQCMPYTTHARHCNIVGGLSKCHSFFQ